MKPFLFLAGGCLVLAACGNPASDEGRAYVVVGSESPYSNEALDACLMMPRTRRTARAGTGLIRFPLAAGTVRPAAVPGQVVRSTFGTSYAPSIVLWLGPY